VALIKIEEDLCKGCGLCVTVCAREAIAMGEKINNKGFNIVELVDPEECNGCTLCAVMCPDIVISVYK